MMLLRRLGAAAGLVLLLSAAPAYAQYGQGTNEQCLQPKDENGRDAFTFRAGDEIIVEGRSPSSTVLCFDPRSRVTVLLESSPVVLAVVDADDTGSFRTPPATIPRDTTPGSHTLRAQGTLNSRPVEYTRAITIIGAPTQVPVTGVQIAMLVGWAVALLVGGAFLIRLTWNQWHQARIEAANLAEFQGHPPIPTVTAEDIESMQLRAISRRPAPTTLAGNGSSRRDSPAAVVSTSEAFLEADVTTDDVTPNGEPEPIGGETEEVVERVTSRSSDLVSRLRDEISTWNAPKD